MHIKLNFLKLISAYTNDVAYHWEVIWPFSRHYNHQSYNIWQIKISNGAAEWSQAFEGTAPL